MKPYVPKPRRKRQRYYLCAYCRKREYNIGSMVDVTGGGKYRSESHLAHKACATPKEKDR